MMWVNVGRLASLANPLLLPPWKEWKSGPIDIAKVTNTISEVRPREYNSLFSESEHEHIARIAYYVRNGWADAPISLVLRDGIYPIWDGVHRVCAAIIRNDEDILANVEGDPIKIRKLY